MATASQTDANLWQMSQGETRVITGFAEQLPAAYKKRLTELGFRAGASILCTMAPRLGAPKLFKVANSVYSLEKELAAHIHTQTTSAL